MKISNWKYKDIIILNKYPEGRLHSIKHKVDTIKIQIILAYSMKPFVYE